MGEAQGAATGQFELKLFGPFRLAHADGRDIIIRSHKSKALIALLATSKSGERERKYLRDMLWERSGRKERLESLSQELSRLRRALKTEGADQLLLVDRQLVRLNLPLLCLDLPDYIPSEWLQAGNGKADFLEGIDLPGCNAWYRWLEDQRETYRQIVAEKIVERRPATAVFGAPVPSADEIVRSTRLSRPPKPSVAVLPFATAAAQDRWLGLALADDLAVRLSHFPQLFVAGSSSAASMANMGLLRREIAERLGVRYTIDGLILPFGERLRVSVGLVDGDTGGQVWGDVFMAIADGSGALEQEIANRIAPRIWTKIDVSERQVGLRGLGVGSSRYERWWQASALFRSFERKDVLEAARLADQLADEDPNCAFSTSLAAFLNGLVHLLGLTSRDDQEKHRAELHCQAALRHGSENVEVLGYCVAAQLMIGGDLEVAEAMVARAMAILPAYQPILFWGGWVDIVAGRPDSARERLELALRINPVTGVRGPTLCGIGFSHLQAGRLEEAHQILREARKCDPSFPLTYPALLVAASMLGEADEAAETRQKMQALGAIRFVDLFQSPVHRQIFAAVLQNAVT